MAKACNHLAVWITKNQCIFPLLAFIIPLAVRTIPEILMGPFVVGFDTMGFYIPSTLLWLHGGINLWSFLVTAPLFYTIYISIVAIGVSPVFALKIISPVLLGFLGLSIFTYANRGLCWSSFKSTFVALLATIYFVALRASWDQLREELGLVFFFVVLMLLLTNRKNNSWNNYFFISLAMTAVVLSHQLASVLMLMIVIATVVYNLVRKDFNRSINLTVASLPAGLYFIIVYLNGVVSSGILGYRTDESPLATWNGFASYQSMLISEGGFFLYCFLPLLPLVVVGFWRFKNLQHRVWLLLSLILLLLPLTSVSPYRWVLLLTYPFAFLATDAITKLKSIKWKRSKLTMNRLAILYLIFSTAIFSAGFIYMTSESPFFYFNPNYLNKFEYQIPTSMLQNTISINDCQDAFKAVQWYKDNITSSGLLLTHTVFYGWALLTLNEIQVKSYGFDNPVHAAATAALEGHKQLYLIWWINGQGWYEQPSLPNSFLEIYHSGDIAIYQYSTIS